MAQLVALDIDGTLIHYDGRMSDRVTAALSQAAERGHHLVIATGRSVTGSMDVMAQAGLLHGLGVFSNGALTCRLDPSAPHGYQVTNLVTFDPTSVIAMVREHLPDALFAVEDLDGIKISREWPGDNEIAGRVDVVPLEQMLAQPTTRVVVYSPDHDAEEFAEVVGRIGLHGVEYSIGYSAWLDLAPAGVSKASALEQVRRELGVDPEHTIALGDGRNDLEMLTWAARGIAMGNAHDDLKAVADEIGPDVREDGAAVLLESLPEVRP
ncbi:MAG: HAD family hydrolase [Actinomycetales bacterium]